MEQYARFFVIIGTIIKVINVQKLGFWRILGAMIKFNIVTWHVTPFWNPWDHEKTILKIDTFTISIKDKNVKNIFSDHSPW